MEQGVGVQETHASEAVQVQKCLADPDGSSLSTPRSLLQLSRGMITGKRLSTFDSAISIPNATYDANVSNASELGELPAYGAQRAAKGNLSSREEQKQGPNLLEAAEQAPNSEVAGHVLELIGARGYANFTGNATAIVTDNSTANFTGNSKAMTTEKSKANFTGNSTAIGTESSMASINEIAPTKPKEKAISKKKFHEIAKEDDLEELQDKLELDYKGKAKMENKSWLARHGLHPVQAFGMLFLVVMFAFWFHKLWREHTGNTW